MSQIPIQQSSLIAKLYDGQFRALARCISLVENEVRDYQKLLQTLQTNPKKPPQIVGITGPPGAGKSTLINSLIGHYTLQKNQRVALLAVDPTSPFNYGALLGDRIRLNDHYNNPNVYIRSVATRGSLGGLSDKILEIVEVIKAAPFDLIIVETVGVGQSEVEIAGLADTTIVLLVPEAGDEIQTMKAGLMEVANIFVVNKSDRPHAEAFVQNLRKLVHSRPKSDWYTPVIKAIATQNTGIAEIAQHIQKHHDANLQNTKKAYLLARKAVQIIQKNRMKDIDKRLLYQQIQLALVKNIDINLYSFLKKLNYLD